MATFTANKPVNLSASGLPEFAALGNGSLSVNDTHTGHEFDIQNPAHTLEFDFESTAGHPFVYAHGITQPPTGGTIESIQVNTGASLTMAYKFAGLHVSVPTFTSWINNHQIGAALNTMFGGADTINGSHFADVLNGFGGNDGILGRAGSDTINGGAGKDRINGGAGNDRLSGAAGNDTFVFQAGFGKDVITDFAAGPAVGDVIEMHGLFHSLAAVKNHSHVNAAHHLVIEVDATDTITLNTVHSKAALSANDFHFLA